MTTLPLTRPTRQSSSSRALTKKRGSASTFRTKRRTLLNAAVALPLSLCDDDSLYTVTLKIGTQSFQLVVDTASTDLWVMDQDCLFCMESPNRYDITNASLLYDNDDDNYYESVSGSDQVRSLFFMFDVQARGTLTRSLTHSILSNATHH